jgi:4,5-DOPA dioxygenase extradiol
MTRVPALFVGHGSPMNTLEVNGYTEAWAAFGRHLPRPKAVLVVSAHWYFGATAVTGMSKPRTIHDFYGFPQELFDFDYPAPGAPDLAQDIIDIVKPEWVGLDHDQWGLDHGAWSVLAHLYPNADIPVVQLSINALKPLEYHLDIARRLAAIRQRGVMIVGSGNVVHNLRRLKWNERNAADDWAERFDDAVMRQLSDEPGDILRVREHADYLSAVPTPEHFIPLLYLAGLAAAGDEKPEVLVRGYSMGSLSMTCYGLDAIGILRRDPICAAKLPQGVPPDQTNI